MSSTKRSDIRTTHIADYYVTPQYAIRDFLNKFCEDERLDLFTQHHLILDPCAWWDEKHDMSYPAVLFEYWADYNKIITNDIRENSRAQRKSDFLQWDRWNSFDGIFDIVITNPPFNIAQQIIEKSFEFALDWWYVIMLLRLNYFWSKQRKSFREKYPPYSCYVHSKRMSFTEWGKTDSIEYMHCVWKKDMMPDFTKLYII